MAAVTKRYSVTARRWSGGWELHIENVGVTQVRTLDRAVGQVRDYLETIYDSDFSAVEIDVIPEIGGLERAVKRVRTEVRRAAETQKAAADNSRKLARQLRDRGLSVTDVAVVLGVSRGRVSQLTTGDSSTRIVTKKAAAKSPAAKRVASKSAAKKPAVAKKPAAAKTTVAKRGTSGGRYKAVSSKTRTVKTSTSMRGRGQS